jgi:hypothetical protein
LRSALFFDDFLRIFKALTAIRALPEACIGRFCVPIATRSSVAKISLADCVADADIHGRRITPAKRLQEQYMRVILNNKR